MTELKITHVLMFVIVAFVLYHMQSCGCSIRSSNNGFSVSAAEDEVKCSNMVWGKYNNDRFDNSNTRVSCNNCVDHETSTECNKCEDGYVFDHYLGSNGPVWRCTKKEDLPIIPDIKSYYGTCYKDSPYAPYMDQPCEDEVPNSVCNPNIQTKEGYRKYACNCVGGYHQVGNKCVK